MFNFLKKKGFEAVSPAFGELEAITSVKDDVFSNKMLGDGFAVEPSKGEAYAPVSGKITTLFPTKHAIGITTKDGLEVLIHMGIDTVELKGLPFDINVELDQEVKAGTKLANIDLDAIKKAGLDPTIIVVYTNMDLIKKLSPVEEKSVLPGDVVQEVKLK